jgi:hypothetical protein
MQRASSLFCFLVLVIASLACKGSGKGGDESTKPYKSPQNDFSITFPAGSKEPVAKRGSEDVTYLSANGDGTYKVRVVEKSGDPAGSLEGFLIGAGVFTPSEAQTKETTFQNMPALESRGWTVTTEVGGGTRVEVRLLAFKPPNVNKVFEIRMETTKKENLETKAANDFFNSFKLGAS